MNRRETFSLFRAAPFLGAAWLAATRAAAADAGLRFAGLDHIEFTVSDVEKSLAFYAAIFGNAVMKNKQTTRRYIRLGSSYLALDKAQDVRVDHFCAGMDAFDISGVHAYLQQRGIAYRDFPSGKDLAITDPEGVRTQLAASEGWSQLATGTAAPETVALRSGQSIFRATGLDHILLNVMDPEKSAGFYEKIFGPVAERSTNRIWFQAGKSRIGLLQTPSGQRAGVNHYCVSASAFDYDSASRKLVELGAKVEVPETAGSCEFRDADGFLIQVKAT